MVLGFTAYCLSIVPGQSLMRDQVWDISWKLGNTAENGAVVSGGMFFFARIFFNHVFRGPLIVLPD